MNRIAVAGGSGAVGKTFIEELQQTNHHIFILTRRSPHSPPGLANVSHVQVNYDDIDATARMLEGCHVDTVISAISIESEATSKSQLNLIEAAERSSATRRFIPSEYGFLATKEVVEMDSFAQFWVDNAEALEKTSLQWTRIVNGFFMDYWGMPHIKTHLHPFPWAIDVESKTAALPGTGDDILSLTYSFDLAKFIVRILDLENWPRVSVLVGQDVTFNQLLRMAEHSRGLRFNVTYDNEETLKKGNATMLRQGRKDTIQSLVSLFGRMTMAGHFHMPTECRASNLFPDLKLLSVEEMIMDNWG